ncbi:MAG: hypothetical protein ACK5LL_05795, partial [Suipraeoptans sp.]
LYIDFMKKEETAKCLDVENLRKRISDNEALMIIQSKCGIVDVAQLQQMDKRNRDLNIIKIEKCGISLR